MSGSHVADEYIKEWESPRNRMSWEEHRIRRRIQGWMAVLMAEILILTILVTIRITTNTTESTLSEPYTQSETESVYRVVYPEDLAEESGNAEND